MIQTVFHTAGTFIDLAALSAVIGLASYLMVLAPNMVAPKIIKIRMRRFLIVSLVLLLVGSADNLIQRAMEMSGLGIISIFPLLPTVIFKSHYGSMWLVRLFGLLAAWIIALVGRRWTDSRLFGLLLFCAGAIIAFSRSASGHPADFGDLSTQQIADWMHLLAASCLAGTLLANAYLFPPGLIRSKEVESDFMAGVADRFYLLLGPALALLVTTGLYNARFTVGSFQNLATTTYGRLLFVKVSILILLALRSIAPPAHGNDHEGYVIKFLKRSQIDAVLALWILLIVSQIVHTIPAVHQAHLAQAKESEGSTRAEGEPTVLLTTDPQQIVAGSPAKMTVSIRDHDNRPLQGLMISHERILHAVIISRDLSFFAHIHPEDLGPVTAAMLKDAALPLRFTFPRAGEYLIGFDFAANDEAYSKTISITVAQPPVMGSPHVNLALTKDFGDYSVSLELPPGGIRAGIDTQLHFVIQKNGKAVTDLEPYLGAPMHLAVVPINLKSFIHVHGEVPGEDHAHHDHLHAAAPPASFGPEIAAEVVMPARGMYKIFSQVQHKGNILLFEFMVDVQ